MSRSIRLFALLAGLALPALALAQAQDVPLRIGFQGRLLAADGTPLAGLKQVTFRIYASPTTGSARWEETQQLLLTNGYYATFLGASTPLGTTAAPATSVFDGADLYLGVEVAGAELTPRQQIGSVGYAIRAAHAVHASNADEARHAASASAVDTTWLADQSVNHAKVATSVDGGAVNATTVRASSSVTAASAAVSGDVSAGSLRTGNLTATGATGLADVSARSATAASLTVTGAASFGTVNATTLVHMPGAVVGGFSITTSGGGSGTPTYSCTAWGDGQCAADNKTGNCNGGSHPPGYVYGVVRGNLCIQP